MTTTLWVNITDQNSSNKRLLLSTLIVKGGTTTLLFQIQNNTNSRSRCIFPVGKQIEKEGKPRDGIIENADERYKIQMSTSTAAMIISNYVSCYMGRDTNNFTLV